MKNIIHQTKNCIEFFFSWFSLLLLFSMLLITVFQIVLRNFFGINLTIASEIAQQKIIWLTFTGGILTTLKRKHIAIDIAARILPDRFKYILAVCLNICAALICGVMAWYSIKFVKVEIEFASTIANKIPSWTFQIIIPIGFAFMALAFLLNINIEEDEKI